MMEERRWRTDDRPRSALYERLMATALLAHPYRYPVVGWMSDLENMRAQDAHAFYERWYAPNNAILVVVGDVAPGEVFALARQHFGGIAAKTSERKPQDEPQQLGLRRLTVKAPAELPYVLMAFRAPKLADPERDWEPYALEMLANVLDGNAAARLPRTLVQTERLANSASASYDGVGRGPGMFYLDGVPAAGERRGLEQALPARYGGSRSGSGGGTRMRVRPRRCKPRLPAGFDFFQARQSAPWNRRLPHTTLELRSKLSR